MLINFLLIGLSIIILSVLQRMLVSSFTYVPSENSFTSTTNLEFLSSVHSETVSSPDECSLSLIHFEINFIKKHNAITLNEIETYPMTATTARTKMTIKLSSLPTAQSFTQYQSVITFRERKVSNFQNSLQINEKISEARNFSEFN